MQGEANAYSLHMHRPFFLSLFLEQHRVTSIYIALASDWYYTRNDFKSPGRRVWVLCKHHTSFYKRQGHLWEFLIRGLECHLKGHLHLKTILCENEKNIPVCLSAAGRGPDLPFICCLDRWRSGWHEACKLGQNGGVQQ